MLMEICALVSIIATLANMGVGVHSIWLNNANANVKTMVNDLISAFNKAISSKRLNVNKLINLVSSRNNNALMNYLYNNPIISKRLKQFTQDSELISALQSKQNSLESDINSLLNQLQSLGYAQNLSSSKAEDDKRYDIYKQLKSKEKEYKNLETEAGKQIDKAEAVETASTYTSDLDARSQNIKGGLI